MELPFGNFHIRVRSFLLDRHRAKMASLRGGEAEEDADDEQKKSRGRHGVRAARESCAPGGRRRGFPLSCCSSMSENQSFK
jgi:hypothetical protein